MPQKTPPPKFSLEPKQFRYRYWEILGDPPAEADAHVSDIKFVSMMGVSYEDFPGLYSAPPPSTAWSTTQPDNKRVMVNQPEFLYWPATTEVDLKIKVDLNETGGLNTYTVHTFNYYFFLEMVFVCCTLDAICNAVSRPTAGIDWYKVYLTDGADVVVTDKRTYYIESYTPPEMRCFLFRNPAGGFDTLRTVGESEHGFKNKKTLASKVLPYDYKVEDGEQSIVAFEARQTFTANSGVVNKETIEYLQSFLISDLVFEIVNGEFLPVIVDSKKAKISQARNHMHSLQFNYEYAFNQLAHTNL